MHVLLDGVNFKTINGEDNDRLTHVLVLGTQNKRGSLGV